MGLTDNVAMQRQFAAWVGLLEPCLHHYRTYWELTHWIADVLEYNEVPEFWREPVRVMAQGGYYYGADAWMAKHARRDP
jgi:hypothetical protein